MALKLPLWSRHARFYLALGAGVLAGAAAVFLPPVQRLLLGSNLFFAIYLVLMFRFASSLGPGDLRRHAESADEGTGLIILVAGCAVSVSLAAIFVELNTRQRGDYTGPALALLSVPLGWAVLHMLMAFHYARAWYAKTDGREDAGGLAFPGTPQPGVWEFLYNSYVIGMCAQVADVEITTTAMRRLVMIHSAASFFFNTVLIAVAVNAAISFGQ
ncbi:MAG: DUF1345 domain-containing protein [Paracoccus sp. (in: a-proteobacteria)]|nr:DUF1345 domain-containing protein [Paracoccus sp. (in: a-proteobacteria)]